MNKRNISQKSNTVQQHWNNYLKHIFEGLIFEFPHVHWYIKLNTVKQLVIKTLE